MSDLLQWIPGQFFSAAGIPLNGGLIQSYAAGSTIPLATYTDQSGLTPNSNPVVLDSSGGLSTPIWLGPSAYKFVIMDASSNILRTIDNVWSISYQIAQAVAGATSAWTSVPISYTQLQTAGLSNAIALYTLPQKTIIKNVVIYLRTQFAGTSIATLIAQVGISGNYSQFIDGSNPNMSLIGAVSGSSFDNVSASFLGSISANTIIYLNAIATGANLSALSAGALTVDFEIGAAP